MSVAEAAGVRRRPGDGHRRRDKPTSSSESKLPAVRRYIGHAPRSTEHRTDGQGKQDGG